jgi:hypothetical protein
LLKVPSTLRDNAWFAELYEVLPFSWFSMGEAKEQCIKGPDLCYYISLSTTRHPDGIGACLFEAIDPAIRQGVGIVIDRHQNPPSYVLSFGDLACYKMFKTFVAPSEWMGSPFPPNYVVQEEMQVFWGGPDENILPMFVRVMIDEYMRWVGIEEPKVLMAYFPERGSRILLFNIVRENLKNPKGYDHVYQLLRWHLPRGYQVADWELQVRDLPGIAAYATPIVTKSANS